MSRSFAVVFLAAAIIPVPSVADDAILGEVLDRRTVMFEVVRGRDDNLRAILTFSDDLT
jgi:hypothetical protein